MGQLEGQLLLLEHFAPQNLPMKFGNFFGSFFYPPDGDVGRTKWAEDVIFWDFARSNYDIRLERLDIDQLASPNNSKRNLISYYFLNLHGNVVELHRACFS